MQKKLATHLQNKKVYARQRTSLYDNIKNKFLSKCKYIIGIYFDRVSKLYRSKFFTYKKRILAVQFFDYNRSCPAEIINCKELREVYTQELKELEKYKMCTTCKLPFLQEKIIDLFIISEPQ